MIPTKTPAGDQTQRRQVRIVKSHILDTNYKDLKAITPSSACEIILQHNLTWLIIARPKSVGLAAVKPHTATGISLFGLTAQETRCGRYYNIYLAFTCYCY